MFKGLINSNGSHSSVLYNVKITVFNSTTCENYQRINYDYQICAGNYSGGQGVCQGSLNAIIYFIILKKIIKGDSGGGLYTYDPVIQKYILSGITSYGVDPCDLAGYPG